jgi:hypothetical protein
LKSNDTIAIGAFIEAAFLVQKKLAFVVALKSNGEVVEVFDRGCIACVRNPDCWATAKFEMTASPIANLLSPKMLPASLGSHQGAGQNVKRKASRC